MYEASSHVIRSQVGVLLGGCHGNIASAVPRVVQLWKDGVDAGVMGRDCIVIGEGRDGVMLEGVGGGGRGEGGRGWEGGSAMPYNVNKYSIKPSPTLALGPTKYPFSKVV